jgi:globin
MLGAIPAVPSTTTYCPFSQEGQAAQVDWPETGTTIVIKQSSRMPQVIVKAPAETDRCDRSYPAQLRTRSASCLEYRTRLSYPPPPPASFTCNPRALRMGRVRRQHIEKAMRIPAATLILALALTVTSAEATFMKKRSLYERLGGQQAIITVVDAFVANVAADKRINRFFANTDMPRLKRRLVEQIYAAAGRPCEYKAAA